MQTEAHHQLHVRGGEGTPGANADGRAVDAVPDTVRGRGACSKPMPEGGGGGDSMPCWRATPSWRFFGTAAIRFRLTRLSGAPLRRSSAGFVGQSLSPGVMTPLDHALDTPRAAGRFHHGSHAGTANFRSPSMGTSMQTLTALWLINGGRAGLMQFPPSLQAKRLALSPWTSISGQLAVALII